MTNEEAYQLGLQLGHQEPPIPRGISIAARVANTSLPVDIRTDTSQARTFRLGYHDGMRGRRVPVRIREERQ